MIASIQRLTNAVNLYFVLTFARLSVASRDRASIIEPDLRAVLTGPASPEFVYLYYFSLGFVWLAVSWLLGMATVGLAYSLHLLFGRHGNDAGAAMGFGAFAFAFVGCLDALWRYFFAAAAHGRWREAGYIIDDTVRSRLRIATVDDCTLLIQLAVGVWVGWKLWS